MKNITKALCLILVLAVFATMAMGSGSRASDTTTTTTGGVQPVTGVSVNSGTDTNSSTESETSNVTASMGNTDSGISVEQQVLLDENGVKITATGMQDGMFGTELTLLIENNTTQNIIVQVRNASVNGYMVDTMMSSDVAAGKKTNDSLTFLTSGLKECGIEQIADIEFIFHIFDADSWDEMFDSSVISLKTSASGNYVQNVDDSGTTLIDSNGIKIVAKGLSSESSFFGPGVILYIENNSAQDITVQVRDVSINGFMVDSTMSEDVIVGKKAISAIQFFDSDLEDNGISTINNVEFYFHIFDMNTWDEILDSDVITLSFN